MPIHELLNRIRWDSEFAKGDFQLGYYDRAEDRIIQVPLKEITFPEDSPQTFRLVDIEGQVHRIPFHRVREERPCEKVLVFHCCQQQRSMRNPSPVEIESAQARTAG